MTKLFKSTFYGFSQQVFNSVRTTINHASSAELEATDSFVGSLIASKKLKPLNVDWASLVMLPQPREERTMTRDSFFDEDVETVTPVYMFEVQYSGDRRLFDLQPSTSVTVYDEFEIEHAILKFEVRGKDKRKLESIKKGLQENLSHLNSQVDQFNEDLKEVADKAVEARKKVLDDHSEGVNAFDVPIKDTDE